MYLRQLRRNRELEEELMDRYGLQDVIVVDSASEDDDYMLRDIGAAAAYYVETTIQQDQVVGLSSWSETLLAMVDAMHQLPRATDAKVVQILKDYNETMRKASRSPPTSWRAPGRSPEAPTTCLWTGSFPRASASKSRPS